NVCGTPGRADVMLKGGVYSPIMWACALLAGLAAGLPGLTGPHHTEGSRTALTFGDPNVCANYFYISLALVWATGRPRRRSLRVLVSVLLIAAMVSTGSNSALVSLAVGLSATFVFATFRRSGLIPALAATVCIL